MKVKKYIVNSMPEALQKIRSELGKDAVILNTKELRVGGMLGLFSKKKIEVVAAVDSNPDPSPQARAFDQSVGVHRPAAPIQAAPPLRPASASAYPSSPSSGPPPAALLKDRESELLREMKQMKEMMRKLAAGQALADSDGEEQGASAPEAFERIRQRLIEQDVLPELSRRLVDQAWMSLDGPDRSDISFSHAREAVKHQIVNVLTQHPMEPIRPNAKIVHFVGPTGVGKTTTIAKLAAELALKHRRSLGLITSDTYRIAAIEQLRTYASILDIPLEVVFSPLDLQKALDKFEDRDMILMDTAGRNFRNEMAVSELHSLLRLEANKDTFLVLSLSMKYNDMKAVTDNFYKFGLEKVLFTKADETDNMGSVLNLLDEFPLSLSYITTGQNVPDDIQKADAFKIADGLVGEAHDE